MDAYSKEKRELARALDRAAQSLTEEAERLRGIAKSHVRQAARWDDLNRHVATAPHLFEWLKRLGSNDPIAQAAERIGALPEFIEAHYAALGASYD